MARQHKIDKDILEIWIKSFRNDEDVQSKLEETNSMLEDILERQTCERVHLNIPPEFRKEMYAPLLAKILATIRYRAYPKVQQLREDSHMRTVTDEDMARLIRQVDIEEFRGDVLRLFEIPIPEGETAKTVMHKAYIHFTTISEGEDLGKNRF